jgi:tetratricopeptide (TPR) repeat protein
MKIRVVMMAALAMLALATAGLAQDAAKEEADAYKAWYDAYTAKDAAKRLEFGKAFMEKFPNSKNIAYVKGDVVKARGELFNAARQAKNVAEEIRLGEDALAANPEDIDYLYFLAFDLRAFELFANPPNYTHEAKAVEYTQRLIKLIEAGKVPNVVPKDKWNQNVILAYFNHTFAALEQKNNNADKAIEIYKKCISLDPSGANYFFQIGSLYYTKYSAAAKKFEALPTEKKQQPENDPEAKVLLADLNAQADAVIDSWARFLALSKTSPQWASARPQIEEAAGALYKFRHPDSPTGFQDLVNKYATGAPPTN